MRLAGWLATPLAAITMPLLGCAADKDTEMDHLQRSLRDAKNQYTNHLAGENSPYLLSHAHNPVNWYPWGDEALEKARTEDKPIFLSIGYAACHWCHVMERESFENEEIAAILNEHFVSIKVDREQRPDLDEIYMSFTTALTGHGGWPMSVFMTPDLKPFFAGTYFPPEDRYGRPGFNKVITEIAKAYREQKQQVVESSESIFNQLAASINTSIAPSLLSMDMINRTARALMQNFDDVNGGFGSAPKFPHALELSLFLRYFRATGDSSFLKATELALSRMANGGIHDHLGGGFARYATDGRWLVPHFEKMLYDNALLVPLYVEAYQVTRSERYLAVVRETLDFILREMTDTTGGFYSALDADSEGEEGRFYVWHKSEIDSLLGEDGNWFCQYYNVTERGNFEGKNILNLDATSERIRRQADVEDFGKSLDACKRTLFEARSKRVRPLTDDKILTSWNGLALSAFCRGYQVTGERRYLEAAIKNATFIRDELFQDGTLTHSYRQGRHSSGEFLEDYAYLVRGLLDLYETDRSDSHRWLSLAVTLTDRALELFMDAEGRFYLRPDGQDDLIVRPQNERDGAVPAPGSILMACLFKLNRITGNKEYLAKGELALRAVSGLIERYPGNMTAAVLALDYLLNDKIEIVLVGNGRKRDQLLAELYQHYLPNRVIAISSDGRDPIPLFEGREPANGDVMAYVCRNSVCRLPTSDIEEFKQQLEQI